MTRHANPSLTPSDQAAMRLALDAALLGPRGANPLVGAAVVAPDGDVLHVGHHRGAGTPHAEIDAIRQAAQAGTDLRSCSMVVTLEPCNHTGRTGPCAQAILAAGIPRVVHAAWDTTSAAAGGAATLRQAGVQVHGGLLADQATDLNHRWLMAQEQQRPFVTVKTAQTLDGRIAATDGSSQWITGAASRQHAHSVRARADAILVGTGTVLADDPRLTARLEPPESTQTRGASRAQTPLRVAMGYRPVPAQARMRGTDGRFRHMSTRDPRSVLTHLYDDGVRHLLVEGGATVVGGFLAADLADELTVYQAPRILGAGRHSFPDLGIDTLTQARRYRPDASDGGGLRQLGDDLLWHLQPQSRDSLNRQENR